MAETRRQVKLPNGIRAVEIEELIVGSNETQAIYSYRYTNLSKVDKKEFETDYWGRIEGLEFL